MALSEFKEVKVLGSGSAGDVIEVVHMPTKRRMAKKVINLFANGSSRENEVVRELASLAGNKCDHLVQLNGAFYQEGRVHIIMELQEGGSLQDIVNRTGPMAERALCLMARQLCKALVHLHEQNQIHKDVKPANCLKASDGTIKLSDFGCIAEVDEENASCHGFEGSVYYMAPERLRGKPFSFASDIWSLGLILVECATGRYPYPESQGLFDHTAKVTALPAPSVPDASPDMSHFIDSCLQKKDSERPTARELLGYPWLADGVMLSY